MDISNGDVNMDVFGFITDVERQIQDMFMSVYTKQYPQGTPALSGPHIMGPPRTDLRASGKLASYKLVSSAIGGDFRIGLLRFDVQPAGARR
jgi:hypothetical protein